MNGRWNRRAGEELTQIGKECPADCAIRRQAGDCVKPREGIFAILPEEGEAGPGDLVAVLQKKKPCSSGQPASPSIRSG